jgi:hypothetical protein
MDTLTATLIGLAVLALVLIYALRRPRVKASLKGLGVGLDVETSGEGATDRPGVTAKRVVSRQGGFTAEDGTGRGAQVSHVDAHGDVRITSAPPAGDPKGRPPA